MKRRKTDAEREFDLLAKTLRQLQRKDPVGYRALMRITFAFARARDEHGPRKTEAH